MALVTIVGFPCSGKSRRSAQLQAFFESKLQEAGYDGPRLSVVVINDDGCHVPRLVYDGMSLIPANLDLAEFKTAK